MDNHDTQKTILIAEDEEDVRHLLEGLMQHYGYGFLSVCNGVEALERLETTKVDVILTDLLMPELGGVELIVALREKYPRTPIVVVTGHPKKDLIQSVLEAGADEYLVKPINQVALADTLKRQLSKAERLSFLMSKESSTDAPTPENPLDGNW